MMKRRGLAFGLPLAGIAAAALATAFQLGACSHDDRRQVSADDPQFANASNADLEQADVAGRR